MADKDSPRCTTQSKRHSKRRFDLVSKHLCLKAFLLAISFVPAASLRRGASSSVAFSHLYAPAWDSTILRSHCILWNIHGKTRHSACTGTDISRRFASCAEPLQASSKSSSFDFASKEGWDRFYADLSQKSNQRQAKEPNSKSTSSLETETELTGGQEQNVPPAEFEWHASIPHSDIAEEIPAETTSCLVIGCGTSSLPRHLYLYGQNRCKEFGFSAQGELSVTCLDYSRPCVEYLSERYGRDCPGMSFVCGDATNLVHCLSSPSSWIGKKRDASTKRFDVVVDKGLLDALMCGEGWDYNVERLLQNVSMLLSTERGMYILVSYKLSASTKQFVQDASPDLQWTFDTGKSTNSVSFSVARRKC